MKNASVASGILPSGKLALWAAWLTSGRKDAHHRICWQSYVMICCMWCHMLNITLNALECAMSISHAYHRIRAIWEIQHTFALGHDWGCHKVWRLFKYLHLDTDDFVLMTDNTVTVVIHCTWNLPYQSKFYLFKLWFCIQGMIWLISGMELFPNARWLEAFAWTDMYF